MPHPYRYHLKLPGYQYPGDVGERADVKPLLQLQPVREVKGLGVLCCQDNGEGNRVLV
ncbi:hypothetical protein ES708_09866 [subsurface metagenome]